MTKEEFIKKAKECMYDSETIQKFIEVVEEYEDVGYEDIYLVKRIIN